MDLLVKAVMFFVLLVTLIVWAVVGFVFWIPLLVRATTIFALALLPAAFNRQDIGGLHDLLEEASSFYFRGFHSAIAVLNESGGYGDVDVGIGRIVVEILWTTAFWLFTIYLVQPAIVRPLFNWLRTMVHR